MACTKAVINESMRLLTSDFACYRINCLPLTLNGIKIPKNTKIVLPMVGLHRNENYWVEPDAFLPERFNVSN